MPTAERLRELRKPLTVYKSQVTAALGVSIFAQLELFDLGDVAKLAGKCYRGVCVGDLNTRCNRRSALGHSSGDKP